MVGRLSRVLSHVPVSVPVHVRIELDGSIFTSFVCGRRPPSAVLRRLCHAGRA